VGSLQKLETDKAIKNKDVMNFKCIGSNIENCWVQIWWSMTF